MALIWDFKKDLMGHAIHRTSDGKEYRTEIYSGNALFIEVFVREDEYQLMNFAFDRDHAKRCLGLTRDRHENVWDCDTDHYVEVVLNNDRKDAHELGEIIIKAHWKHGITVSFENVEEKGCDEHAE